MEKAKIKEMRAKLKECKELRDKELRERYESTLMEIEEAVYNTIMTEGLKDGVLEITLEGSKDHSYRMVSKAAKVASAHLGSSMVLSSIAREEEDKEVTIRFISNGRE